MSSAYRMGAYYWDNRVVVPKSGAGGSFGPTSRGAPRHGVNEADWPGDTCGGLEWRGQ